MKKILVIAFALALAGCATMQAPPPPPQVITVTKMAVVMPDERMYQCPILRSFPNHHILTDLQVAKLLQELYKNNKVCHNSIVTLKKFMNNSKATIEKKR